MSLTILGRGKSWVQCPFEGEIWAASTVLVAPGMSDKHYDKVFAFDKCVKGGELDEALAIAKKRNIPIVSKYCYATERYPLLDIFREFQTVDLRNTVAYMIALALYKGYKDLHLYGVDQDEGEYALVKHNVTFWLGMAHGRGVRYTVANKTFPRWLTPEMNKILEGTYESQLKV